MNRVHLKLDCVSLGCSLGRKTNGFAGAKHGQHRGWEWDAEKEEMANDSTAAWRWFVYLAKMSKWKI